MVLLRLMLLPLVPVYKWIIGMRNFMFNKGIFKTKKVNAKVVAVGNITVGGSGKTPAVIYITKVLKNSGLKTGVLSRGYGRKSRGYVLVSDGSSVHRKVDECGDEIVFTAVECGVPAAVCENRVEGAEKLIADCRVEAIVLDDAFQHRWIKRDADIVLFDQNFLIKSGGMDQCSLPVGFMREQFNSLKRSDAVIINRKFSDSIPVPISIRPYLTGREVFTAHYSVVGIFDVKNHQRYDISEFCGQRSLVVSGVAQPDSFLSVLKKNDIDCENKLIFRDHKSYSLKDIQLIRNKFYSTNAQSVVTTEKDAVKLIHYADELDDIDIFYLKIELVLDKDKEFRDFLLKIV